MQTFFTEAYDETLKKEIEHFQSYPEMLPFIGVRWKESKEKILLLGESHFLPEGCKERLSDSWYKGKSENLYPDEKKCISTRNIVNNMYLKSEGQKKHPFFLNIARELISSLSYDGNCAFTQASFYNYFQRPAPYGASLNAGIEDHQQAYTTLKAVAAIIDCKKIIFTSRKAWSSFTANRSREKSSSVFNGIFLGQTVHPACIWWNRTSKSSGNKTGRQKFIELLSS